MAWPEIEPTTSHLVYPLLSFFLILYALFSELIKNGAHLSEPPLATLTGVIFGPRGLTVLNPFEWGFEDNVTQELSRIIVGIQVFAVGIELPGGYMGRHWRSILVLLGPLMTFGWIVCALIIYLVLQTSFTTALIVAACLTPTDPVLSASVLGEAKFSARVPHRIRAILSAESGCNDGTAFPFLYVGLFAAMSNTAGEAGRRWFTDVIIWQCAAGIVFGTVVGWIARESLKWTEKRGYTQEATLFVFYFLLAIFCVGIGSTLGLDDFLVAFAAGTAFCWDGWFSSKTHKMKLPSILDLMLNSTMFVYFGSIIPWQDFTGNFNAWKLTAVAVLILLFRRLPAMMALKWAIPEIKTWSEGLFAGHFGPMGVGAIFLAMEARARLETGTSGVLPHPPGGEVPHNEAIKGVWPIISFVVLWSIMIHGCSAIVMSIYGHFSRPVKERAPLLGGESEILYGMAEADRTSQLSQSDSASDDD